MCSSDLTDDPFLSRDYHLSAVLLHMGDNATSGHYMAHICDEATGEWWKFNDSEITSLFGCTNIGDFDRDSRQLYGLAQECEKPLQSDRARSGNAYMLIYTKDERPEVEVLPSTAAKEHVEKVNGILQFRADDFTEKNAEKYAALEFHTQLYRKFLRLAPIQEENSPD